MKLLLPVNSRIPLPLFCQGEFPLMSPPKIGLNVSVSKMISPEPANTQLLDVERAASFEGFSVIIVTKGDFEVAPLLVETPVVSTFQATSFWRS